MISVVIIASNAEETIKDSLDSLREFDEVILYLNNSSDRTKEIAKEYSNVKIIDGYFDGFGTTKKRATRYASNNWIFILDSDELFTKELIEELKNLELKRGVCYKVNRKNLFLGEEVKFSGWNPDWIVRLYNREDTNIDSSEVHESVIADGLKVKKLKERIIHYAIRDVREFLLKTYHYSSLKRKRVKIYYPTTIFLKALFAFFKTYILKLGFLDGYKGLVIGVGNFNGVFFKYMVNYTNKRYKRK